MMMNNGVAQPQGDLVNGVPINGQQINGGSSFTFVKMSTFSSMNCQSMVVNSSTIESGKCYTYCKDHFLMK